jgi:hypothetical protein
MNENIFKEISALASKMSQSPRLFPMQDKISLQKHYFLEVYKFLPSQKLVHLSGYFKHHTGGGQLPKNMYENL